MLACLSDLPEDDEKVQSEFQAVRLLSEIARQVSFKRILTECLPCWLGERCRSRDAKGRLQGLLRIQLEQELSSDGTGLRQSNVSTDLGYQHHHVSCDFR